MAVSTVVGEVSGGVLHRDCETSGLNAVLSLATPIAGARRLLFVTATYSSVVTKSVAIGLKSGEGAAYDSLIDTKDIVASKYGSWFPTGRMEILPGDQIVITAPAGGAGVTCAVSVYSVVQ